MFLYIYIMNICIVAWAVWKYSYLLTYFRIFYTRSYRFNEQIFFLQTFRNFYNIKVLRLYNLHGTQARVFCIEIAILSYYRPGSHSLTYVFSLIENASPR